MTKEVWVWASLSCILYIIYQEHVAVVSRIVVYYNIVPKIG